MTPPVVSDVLDGSGEICVDVLPPTDDLLARLLQIHDGLSELELAMMALVGEATGPVDDQIRLALESIRVAREQLATTTEAMAGAP